MTYVRYALWAVLAGAFIPVMAILNARLGKALGAPTHAAFILFAVGLVVTGAASLLFAGRLPLPAALGAVAPANFVGGVIVAFYILSITMLATRFGVGNAILFAMAAQIVTSAVIDHFGLFGATLRPMTVVRAAGIGVLLVGLTITQLADHGRDGLRTQVPAGSRT
jgi:transporter family-2 protein